MRGSYLIRPLGSSWGTRTTPWLSRFARSNSQNSETLISGVPKVIVKVIDAPIAGASDVLRADAQVEAAYHRLLAVLIATDAPRQSRTKASSLFVYDQRELQAALRAELRGFGWSHGRGLSEDLVYDGVRVPGIQADMLGDGLHVVLEFGNRASWAHNLVTRVLGATSRGLALMTVLVTPTQAFARRIDTNLGTFERVAASLQLMDRWRPEAIPGPIIVVGVVPDPLAPE